MERKQWNKLKTYLQHRHLNKSQQIAAMPMKREEDRRRHGYMALLAEADFHWGAEKLSQANKLSRAAMQHGPMDWTFLQAKKYQSNILKKLSSSLKLCQLAFLAKLYKFQVHVARTPFLQAVADCGHSECFYNGESEVHASHHCTVEAEIYPRSCEARWPLWDLCFWKAWPNSRGGAPWSQELQVSACNTSLWWLCKMPWHWCLFCACSPSWNTVEVTMVLGLWSSLDDNCCQRLSLQTWAKPSNRSRNFDVWRDLFLCLNWNISCRDGVHRVSR